MASHEGPSNRRQSLPPHQVDCVWWKKGYCFRGTKCFFRHDAALAGVDKDKEHTAQTNTSSIAGESSVVPISMLRAVVVDESMLTIKCHRGVPYELRN